MSWQGLTCNRCGARAFECLCRPAEITPRAYQRSHNKAPRGRGSWAFQASRTIAAYDADLYGEIVFAQGPYATAKAEARKLLAGAELIAVLP